MPAGDRVAGSVLPQRRVGCPALLARQPAPQCKGAASRQIGERRYHAFDFVQARPASAGMRGDLDIGDRAEQTLRIGMSWLFEKVLGARLLDLPPGIHDDD